MGNGSRAMRGKKQTFIWILLTLGTMIDILHPLFFDLPHFIHNEIEPQDTHSNLGWPTLELMKTILWMKVTAMQMKQRSIPESLEDKKTHLQPL